MESFRHPTLYNQGGMEAIVEEDEDQQQQQQITNELFNNGKRNSVDLNISSTSTSLDKTTAVPNSAPLPFITPLTV